MTKRSPDPATQLARRRRRRRLIAGALISVVLAAAVVAALIGWYAGRIQRPYKGYATSETFVEVPPGLGVTAIGRRLVAAGVVPDLLTYRIAVRMRGAERALKAGEYRFEKPASPLEVVGRIVRGDVYLLSITFPEGLTIRDMAALFVNAGLGTAQNFAGAARDVSLVRAFDPRAKDLEGYLFPDTYRVPRRTTAQELVATMVARFEQVTGPEWRDRAAESGLTVRQAVTLASLVEKETALPDERPVVAAVYRNRLKRGMGLQCDPTVIYALQRAGRYTGNLTRADLAFDSPYNTYKRAGLPPGPIAAPGRASLEAAVAPADVPFLYFVSRNDGSHAFAETLSEHNRNVREFQVDYFRGNQARGGRAEPRAGR
jgi:UPF0755 protein